MMLDVNELLSDDQSLVAAAGAILSTKSKDLGAASTDNMGNTLVSDVGRGNPVQILCMVNEDFDSAGDAVTCKAAIVMADNAALTSNLTVLHETPAIAQATLVAGYQFRIGCAIPPGITQRYLGIRYTTAVADATAGKVTAGIVEAKQTNPTV